MNSLMSVLKTATPSNNNVHRDGWVQFLFISQLARDLKATGKDDRSFFSLSGQGKLMFHIMIAKIE